MLDCSNYVRMALYNQLLGDIYYGTEQITLYKDLVFETTPQKYVVIGDITETGKTLNNNRFISEVDVNIEIYVEQYKYAALDVVDSISTSILQVIFPSPIHVGIGDVSLAIYPIDRTSSRYLPMRDGDNFISRKILTLKFLVNQDS